MQQTFAKPPGIDKMKYLLPQDKKDVAQEQPKKDRKKEKRKQPPEGEKAPESKVGP